MATSSPINLSMSALPEIDQKKHPDIYRELNTLRNSIRILQNIIDNLQGGTVGQQLTKVDGQNFNFTWV